METEQTTELLTDPGHSRADLAMIRRAIREGWEIPEQLLAALPKIAGAMALDRKEKTHVRLKAIETLIKMKGQNDATAAPLSQPQAATTINVGVRVDNAADPGRTLARTVVERLRAERLSRRDT